MQELSTDLQPLTFELQSLNRPLFVFTFDHSCRLTSLPFDHDNVRPQAGSRKGGGRNVGQGGRDPYNGGHVHTRLLAAPYLIRACYAKPGTDTAYWVCYYAVPSAVQAYAAMRCPVLT
eukprot:3772065-Rhodomonas_salina.1